MSDLKNRRKYRSLDDEENKINGSPALPTADNSSVQSSNSDLNSEQNKYNTDYYSPLLSDFTSEQKIHNQQLNFDNSASDINSVQNKSTADSYKQEQQNNSQLNLNQQQNKNNNPQQTLSSQLNLNQMPEQTQPHHSMGIGGIVAIFIGLLILILVSVALIVKWYELLGIAAVLLMLLCGLGWYSYRSKNPRQHHLIKPQQNAFDKTVLRDKNYNGEINFKKNGKFHNPFVK